MLNTVAHFTCSIYASNKSLVHVPFYLYSYRFSSHDSPPFIRQYCSFCSGMFSWSVFSPTLALLSIIPSGSTALLIMQRIVLLASLSGELLCRLGGRVWSQAKRSIHRITAQQERLRERERAREMEKTWWHGQWGRDGHECNGLDPLIESSRDTQRCHRQSFSSMTFGI